ncbi:MAG: hypothetical protein QXM92_02945 [Candidatus Anstonellales archaeon]
MEQEQQKETRGEEQNIEGGEGRGEDTPPLFKTVKNNYNYNYYNYYNNYKTCKVCGISTILYAHELCTQCYFKFYMRVWRREKKEKVSAVRRAYNIASNVTKTDIEYQRTIQQIQELLDSVLFNEKTLQARLRELINHCASILFAAGVRGVHIVKILAKDIKRLDEFVIIKYIDKQYLAPQLKEVSAATTAAATAAATPGSVAMTTTTTATADNNNNVDVDVDDSDIRSLIPLYVQLADAMLLISYKLGQLGKSLRHSIETKNYDKLPGYPSSSLAYSYSSSSSSSSSLTPTIEAEVKAVRAKLTELHKQASEIFACLSMKDNRTKITSYEYILMLMLSFSHTYRALASILNISPKWISLYLRTTQQNMSLADGGLLDPTIAVICEENANSDSSSSDSSDSSNYGHRLVSERVKKFIDQGFYVTVDRDIKKGERLNLLDYVLREMRREMYSSNNNGDRS